MCQSFSEIPIVRVSRRLKGQIWHSRYLPQMDKISNFSGELYLLEVFEFFRKFPVDFFLNVIFVVYFNKIWCKTGRKTITIIVNQYRPRLCRYWFLHNTKAVISQIIHGRTRYICPLKIYTSIFKITVSFLDLSFLSMISSYDSKYYYLKIMQF